MPNAIIHVEKLRYVYRKSGEAKVAVDELDLSIQPGEIFGLLGPNGAGKTTTVKILTTILRPSEGRATVAGFDVAREPLEVRKQICAVLQENAVETLLSVRDNLELYGYMHGLSARELAPRMKEVVDQLELGSYLEKRAQELSGGYKRRLQVAKALMLETPVLFLDEATTGMDPLIKRRTMQAIREQAKRGRTVLLTTQLLDEAEALCDRMVLMNNGRCIAGGKLSDLRALSTRLFQIHIGFVEQTEEALTALRGLNPEKIEEEDGEISITVRGSEGEWIQHMARISERWPLAHLEIRGANLEQIFFELYGETAQPASTESPR